jgi:hypothetical protein
MEAILDTHRLDVDRQNLRMKPVAVGAAMFALSGGSKSLMFQKSCLANPPNSVVGGGAAVPMVKL